MFVHDNSKFRLSGGERMLHRKHISLVLAISIAIMFALANLLFNTITLVVASGKVYADGYYDSSPGTYVFGGARSNMECADPQVRDGGSLGYSIMRVVVSHKALSDPTPDGAFIEIGCAKAPGNYGTQSRYMYGSWVTTGGVYDDYTFFRLSDGDYAAHDYRVAIKNDNPNYWSFIFDGATQPLAINPGFTRGAEVGCGGEASSSQNAIGVAACLNVRYKNNNLTSWVYLPSHLHRISPGYSVYDISAYSWQSYGNN